MHHIDLTMENVKMKTQFNKETFTASIQTVVRSGNIVADRLQTALEMGFDYYENHGDASFLTKALQAATKARSVKAVDVQRYITAHANVKWVAEKDKEPVFKKKTKAAPVSVTEPEQTWFEFTKQSATKPEYDIDSKIEALIKAARSAFDKETIKEGAEDHTLEMISKLERLIKADINAVA